ncbi:hypothetical protein VPH35_081568 [Triticum aestivum]
MQEQGTRSKSCSANTLVHGAIFVTRRLGGKEESSPTLRHGIRRWLGKELHRRSGLVGVGFSSGGWRGGSREGKDGWLSRRGNKRGKLDLPFLAHGVGDR